MENTINLSLQLGGDFAARMSKWELLLEDDMQEFFAAVESHIDVFKKFLELCREDETLVDSAKEYGAPTANDVAETYKELVTNIFNIGTALNLHGVAEEAWGA